MVAAARSVWRTGRLDPGGPDAPRAKERSGGAAGPPSKGGGTLSRDVVGVLKRHLDPTMDMLRRVAERCPDDLWLDDNWGSPFWQQVYHVLYYLDYWLREDYAGRRFLSLTFAKSLSADLGRRSPDYLTRTEVREYWARAGEKVERIFAALDDERLSRPIRPRSRSTYHDAILGQIRHIQHHVGQCNSILRRAGARTAGWLGYAED